MEEKSTEVRDHEEAYHPAPHAYHDVKTLLSWEAPGRPFRKRGKQFYMTASLITLLIEVILFLFSQYLFMFLVLSLVFAGFALSMVPPKTFRYKISTEGVTIEDHYYLWQELYDFYFRRIEGQDTLHIRTQSFLPGEIILTLGEIHRDQAKHAILPYLPFREYVKPNFQENFGEWLYKNFPLEKS